MSDRVSLEIVDEDVAIAAALDERAADSRAEFLQKAIVGGGTIVAGGVLIAGLPTLAASAPSPAQDAKILNFALLFEYLKAAFYTEAATKGRVNAELLDFAKVVGKQEQAHVAFLRKALGNAARKRPTFAFGNTTTDSAKFAATATTLEDTMVAAYNGQAANVTKATLAAAAKIVSVEARHAGWIRAIMGKNPAPNATDTPKTAAEATAVLNQTAFVKSS
jgi:ferritin-like protein